MADLWRYYQGCSGGAVGSLREYRVKVSPMIAKHGGRYLTKAVVTRCLKAAIGSQNASLS
jgi:uncharacterized protein (DUF1330 family)